MVGPNGAGKTTTIECIEGLRKKDEGTIRVFSQDISKANQSLKTKIGIQLQESSLPDKIKVREAMEMFSSLYPRTIDWKNLLIKLNLEDKVNSYFRDLSGGQKQRLFIAIALINNPELIFLDELSTGLDPQARHTMWDLIKDIRNEGKTIFMTTHYMEEAELLCDRVAIIDQGKIVALDTPQILIQTLMQEKRLIFSLESDFSLEKLKKIQGVTTVEKIGDRIIVHGKEDEFIYGVMSVLIKERIKFREIKIEQPNLEDVFLALTGKKIRE
jgi:ABC-2 type transport system ATP-binding protein